MCVLMSSRCQHEVSQTGWLKITDGYSHSSGGWKSEIKVSAGPSSEGFREGILLVDLRKSTWLGQWRVMVEPFPIEKPLIVVAFLGRLL